MPPSWLRPLGIGCAFGAALSLFSESLGAAPGELIQLLTFLALGVGGSRLLRVQKPPLRLLIAVSTTCACAIIAGLGPIGGGLPTLSGDSELAAAILGFIGGLGWGIALPAAPTHALGLAAVGTGFGLGFITPLPALFLGFATTLVGSQSKPLISSDFRPWVHTPLLALATTVGAATWNASRANLDPTTGGLAVFIGAALLFALPAAVVGKQVNSSAVGAWLVALSGLAAVIGLSQLPLRSWQLLEGMAGQNDPRWVTWLIQGSLAAPCGLALGWLAGHTTWRSLHWPAVGLGLWIGIRLGVDSYGWALGICLLTSLPLALRRGSPNRRLAGAVLIGATLVAWIRPISWQPEALGEGRITHLREARSPSRARAQLERVEDRAVSWGTGGTSVTRILESGPAELELDGYLVQAESRASAAADMAPHLAAALLPQRERAVVLVDPLGALTRGLIVQEFSTIETITHNVPQVRHLADTDPEFMNTMLHPTVRLSRSAADVRVRGVSDTDAILEVAFTPWKDAFQGIPTRRGLEHRKAALAPHGIYMLVATTGWVNEQQFRGLLADMVRVFPTAWAFLPPNGADQVVLVGWAGEPTLNWDTFLEGTARGLEDLAKLEIRSGLDLADRAIAGTEALARVGQNVVRTRQRGLGNNLHRRPPVLLTILRDDLQGARPLFGDSLPSEVGDLLDDRAETQRNFLDLLDRASQGDFKEVYAQSRALLEKTSGARALDPVVEPYLESARAGIALGLKEGPSSVGWTQAQRALSTARLLHPQSSAVQALLGEPLLAQGNLARAAEHFSRALKLEEGRVDALHGLARVALQRGDVAAAERHLITAVERNPADWGAVHNLGVFLYERGRLDEAEERLRKSAHLAGDSIAAPHSALAQLYLANDQPTRALVEAARASSLQPTGLNHYLRGKAYYEVEQLDSAATAFQEAVLSDPSNWQAQGGLGLVYARRGEYKRCAQSFRKVLAAEPGNPAAQENLRLCQDEVDLRSNSQDKPGGPL